MAAVKCDNPRNFAVHFLNGKRLGNRFHNLFQTEINDNIKNNAKPKKKAKKTKEKSTTQRGDVNGSNSDIASPPVIELHGNPSSFNVFSHVRRLVLEHDNIRTAQIYAQSVSSHGGGGDDESDDDADVARDQSLKLPKIVGLGVCGVFELIRETRHSHPSLCVRSLQALLNMLQGQGPEALAQEPAPAIDSLYSLLMDLSAGASSSDKQDSNSLTALACACLASLVVARGDTGKYMSAMTSLLMSPPSLIAQPVKVPHILTSLQKSVHAVLLGKTILPDWLSSGIKIDAKCLKITLPKTERGE